MKLSQLLDVVEAYTKVIIRESKTELWTEHNNKTIIKGKRLCEVLHKETKPYEDYKVIGVEVEDEMLYIAIYKDRSEQQC